MTGRPVLVVAGSTGATGSVLVPLARALGFPVRPLVRARSPKVDPQAVTVDYGDPDALSKALEGAGAVLQLIGTMRHRFASGDTYETSDIGTTRALVEAAKRAGQPHFLLLGAAGTGTPMGAYYQAKAVAEGLVRDSGLPWTIFRPSMLEGGPRKPIPLLKSLTHALGLKKLEPISLEELSLAMLASAAQRGPLGETLEGASLWSLVTEGRSLTLPEGT